MLFGNRVRFLGNRVRFCENRIRFLGNRIRFYENLIRFLGNRIWFCESRIRFLGNRIRFYESRIRFLENRIGSPKNPIRSPKKAKRRFLHLKDLLRLCNSRISFLWNSQKRLRLLYMYPLFCIIAGMKSILIFFLLVFISSNLQSQTLKETSLDTLNKLDSNRKKDGYWIVCLNQNLESVKKAKASFFAYTYFNHGKALDYWWEGGSGKLPIEINGNNPIPGEIVLLDGEYKIFNYSHKLFWLQHFKKDRKSVV